MSETTEATAVKEYVAEISFLHMQPVESSVVILGKDEQEVLATIEKLFHKRQDLVIASIHEKPKGYRDESPSSKEMVTEDSNVVEFPTKKDLN